MTITPANCRCCTLRPRVLRPGLLLAPSSLAARSPQHAALVTASRWPVGQKLRVAFDGGTVADRDELVEAFTEWMLYGELDFTVVGAGDAEVRCLIDNSDQSWSYVGTDALGIAANEPTMTIGWRNDPGRSLHEFGHVCGYPHGDQIVAVPWNKPAVLEYYGGPPNNWSEEEIYQQVLNRDDPATLTGIQWDALSIMDYPIPAVFVTDPSFVVGFNETLSAKDKAFHAQCYPGRWTPSAK